MYNCSSVAVVVLASIKDDRPFQLGRNVLYHSISASAPNVVVQFVHFGTEGDQPPKKKPSCWDCVKPGSQYLAKASR